MTDQLIARSVVAGMPHELYDLQARSISTPSFWPSNAFAQEFDRGLDAADWWRALIAAGVPRDWLLAHWGRAVSRLTTNPASVGRARALIESEAVASAVPPLREGTLVYQGAEPWTAPTAEEMADVLALHRRLRAGGSIGLPQIGQDGTVIGAEPEAATAPATESALEIITEPEPLAERVARLESTLAKMREAFQ